MIAANLGMQLSVTDIDRHHVRGAALEEAIGEPTGAGACVQYPPAGHVEAERVERGVQLLATSADESWPVTIDDDRVARMNLSSGLVGDGTVDQDALFLDRPARVRAAADELSTDELCVETLTPRH